MLKLKQDIIDSIAEFTLLDDPFMSKVFEDDIKRTQFILRIFLRNDKIKVKKASTQKRIKNLQGRDLQLDILAENAEGQKFNVEIQNESSGAIPQRARYHLSLLDAKSLPKSQDFKHLPENYVIFITKKDVLKCKLPIYHIHRTIEKNKKSFLDGSHIIYVNSEIQDATPLGRLMHDFHCKNPDDMYYKELADKVRYFKEDEEGLDIMGDVMEKLMAKREREAIAKAEAKNEAKAAKAVAKAEKNAKIKFAKSLLTENESLERTARLTELSLKEVCKIAEKLSA